MLDTLTRYLSQIANKTEAYALYLVLSAMADRLSSQAVTSAGLVINGVAALFPKIGATAFYAFAKGIPVTLAAGAALPAPAATVTFTTGQFIIVGYFIDSFGTITQAQGNVGATLGAAGFPVVPVGKALIGFLIITYAGTFIGGTTALDTATTVYISPIGAFDPTVLV